MVFIFNWIDQFLWLLIIVPTFVIGIGVLIAVIAKRFWIAPIVTLIFNMLLEFIYYYDEGYNVFQMFSSNSLIFPFFSLIIAIPVVQALKNKKITISFLLFLMLLFLTIVFTFFVIFFSGASIAYLYLLILLVLTWLLWKNYKYQERRMEK